jgi:ferredoxin
MLGMAPDKLLKMLSAIEGRAIKVHPQQCTRLRHRRSACTLCADSCPVEAISWGKSLEVNADKCTSCGLCAAVCPTGTLEAQAPTDVELVQQVRGEAGKGSGVVFACPRLLKVEDGSSIQVNCLGRLDASFLVAAIAWGAKELMLVDGQCEQCRDRNGREIAERAVATAGAVLDSFEVPHRISFVQHMPRRQGGQSAARQPRPGDVSRRDFFSLLMGRAKQTAAVALDGALGALSEQTAAARPLARGEMPVAAPIRQRLLSAALKRLGEPVHPLAENVESPWAQFTYSDTCIGCQMCAHFCPTGALTKPAEPGSAGVIFTPSLCTGCGLCRDLCHWKSVTLSPLRDLTKVATDSPELLPMPTPGAGPGSSRRL